MNVYEEINTLGLRAERAEAELAALRARPAGAWQKCADSQPEQAGWNLVVVPTAWGDRMVTMGYYHRPKDYWELDGDSQAEAADDPTHWQPLPELPEEAGAP